MAQLIYNAFRTFPCKMGNYMVDGILLYSGMLLKSVGCYLSTSGQFFLRFLQGEVEAYCSVRFYVIIFLFCIL